MSRSNEIEDSYNVWQNVFTGLIANSVGCTTIQYVCGQKKKSKQLNI